MFVDMRKCNGVVLDPGWNAATTTSVYPTIQSTPSMSSEYVLIARTDLEQLRARILKLEQQVAEEGRKEGRKYGTR